MALHFKWKPIFLIYIQFPSKLCLSKLLTCYCNVRRLCQTRYRSPHVESSKHQTEKRILLSPKPRPKEFSGLNDWLVQSIGHILSCRCKTLYSRPISNETEKTQYPRKWKLSSEAKTFPPLLKRRGRFYDFTEKTGHPSCAHARLRDAGNT